MKDKALKTLKFMVIFLNFLLIAGIVFFIVTAARLITKSECEDFDYLAKDHDNVKISFSEKNIYIEEKIWITFRYCSNHNQRYARKTINRNC